MSQKCEQLEVFAVNLLQAYKLSQMRPRSANGADSIFIRQVLMWRCALFSCSIALDTTTLVPSICHCRAAVRPCKHHVQLLKSTGVAEWHAPIWLTIKKMYGGVLISRILNNPSKLPAHGQHGYQETATESFACFRCFTWTFFMTWVEWLWYCTR